jgi:hypothetical protein
MDIQICTSEYFKLKQHIETAREESISAVATTISPSCPSLCVLLSMDSMTMARSMIKALGEISFSLYYSFVTLIQFSSGWDYLLFFSRCSIFL